MIHFAFILVKPEDAHNIGAVARAMKTMGHHDLRLVHPQADHLSDRARILAHKSQEILEAAQVYPDLKTALDHIDIACATTIRHRLTKHHYISIRELPELLRCKGESVRHVALVFGGETSGLNDQDLDQCDLVTTIPQSCSQPSLNLAQAVMVYSFVLSEERTQVQIKDQRLAQAVMPVEQYASLKASMQRLMQRLGLNDRYRNYVTKGLSRLGWADLYLLHNLRSSVDRTLDNLEAQIQKNHASKP